MNVVTMVKIDEVEKVETSSAIAHVITSFAKISRIASINCGSCTWRITSPAS